MTPQTRRGFTIIEVLITMLIIASMGIVLSRTFFTSTHTNTKEEILKEVKQNGDFALDVIERMIRNSKSMTTVCGSLGLTAITIINPDAGQTTLGCEDTSGYPRIASVSASSPLSPQYLTSSSVSLLSPGGLGTTCSDAFNNGNFSIDTTKTGTAPCEVTIKFKLYQRTGTGTFESANQLFQTSVVMRNN